MCGESSSSCTRRNYRRMERVGSKFEEEKKQGILSKPRPQTRSTIEAIVFSNLFLAPAGEKQRHKVKPE